MRIAKDPVERKAEFIETATKLYFEKGYESTTIDDITNDMNVAKGTFYYYFKSKKEIFKEVVVEMAREVNSEYIKILNDNTKTIKEKITKYIVYNLRMFNNSRENEMFKLIHLVEFETLHQKLVEETSKIIYKEFIVMLSKGIKDEEIEIDDVEFTASVLIGGLFGAFKLFSTRQDEKDQKQINKLYEFVGKVLNITF